MLAEPSFNTKDLREKTVELLFENFSPPAIFLAKNAVLSSFAMGRQSSLVVDAGHEGIVGQTQCPLTVNNFLHDLTGDLAASRGIWIPQRLVECTHALYKMQFF